MFGNKKTIPPRPHIPNAEYILEDLNHAAVDDVAFKAINKDESQHESLSLNVSNVNNSEDVYKSVKLFLIIKQELKQLHTALNERSKELQVDSKEIQKLADDIKRQAEAALTMH